jgi:hypothetical protein
LLKCQFEKFRAIAFNGGEPKEDFTNHALTQGDPDRPKAREQGLSA